MRVALLSTIESLSDTGGDPAAFLPIAGRTIVQHQLECALALGCERIACHAIGLPQELVALQHVAEDAGAQFHVINGNRSLSGLVRAADELLVFADSLLADQSLAAKLIGDHPCVLALPADEGVAAGYERIDRDHAWAGLFLVRGSAVERLADLSADADPVPSLLRIALQSGTTIKMMPKNTLAGHEWGLVHSPEDAAAMEASWLDRFTKVAPVYAPALTLSDRLAVRLASRPEGAPVGSRGMMVGAAGLAMLAGAAGWYLGPVAGFALLSVSGIAARIGKTLCSVEAIGRSVINAPAAKKRVYWGGALDLISDLALVGISWLASPGFERISVLVAILSLILICRLAEKLPLRGWKILLADRPLMLILLASGTFYGELVMTIQVLSLISLAAIVLDTMRSGLTRA